MILSFLLCQSTSYLMNYSCDTVSVQDCDYTSAKQTHFNHLFNSWTAYTLSLQLQQAFTVQQYLASHSYITCKNQFWYKFSNYHVTHKSTVSCLLNCLHDTSSMQDRKCSCQTSVSFDNLDNIHHTWYAHQDWWNNLLIMEVYQTLQGFQNLIHITHK
jgi:hypothetical protein